MKSMIPPSLVAGAFGALLLAVSPGSRAAEAEGASNAPVPVAAPVSTNAPAPVAGNSGVTNAVPAVAAEAPATNPPPSTTLTGETAAPASMEPVADAAAPGTAAATADDGRNIRFEFSDMPYMDVIRRFAQITGKPLISDVNVDGSLSFSDPQPYNYQEALDTLNLILAGKRAMLVETGRYLRLIPFDDLQKMPLKLYQGIEETEGLSDGEVVTVVLELKNLEAKEVAESLTSMLSKAGSVAPLSRGRGLIVTDRIESIRRVRQLLAQIDAGAPQQRQMKIWPLKNASGTLLADLLNRTFGVDTAPKRTVFNEQRKTWDVLPANPDDYITAIYAEASNTLVLFGPVERMVLAEELITRFETEAGARASEVKVYYPQMPAEELARMVREAIPGIASTRGSGRDSGQDAGIKARVIADSTSNRLIVTAPASGQLDAIENLIHQLDPTTQETPPATDAGQAPARELRIVQLQTVSADVLVPILRDAFLEQMRNERGSDFTSRARIIADPSGGRVLLSGLAEELDQIAALIAQLDSSEQTKGVIRVFKLKVANARNVAAMIMGAMGGETRRSYDYRRSGGLQRPGSVPARAISDDSSNSVIVMAAPEQMSLIEEVIQRLEEGAETAGRELRILTLEKNSATAVVAMLSQLFYADIRTSDPSRRVAMSAAADDRTIAFEAPTETLGRIEETVKALDVEPVSARLEIRTYAVPEGRVGDIAATLSRLFAEQRGSRGGRGGGEPEPRFEADGGSDTLIVAATEGQFDGIEKLLETLRTAVSAATQMRTFHLQHAKAQDVLTVLETMLGQGDSRSWYSYSRYRSSGGGNEFKISVAPALNAIIMQAAPQKLALATQLIQNLDVPQSSETAAVRTVTLKQANADEVASAVSRMLAPRDWRGEPSAVRVTAVSGSKTLLVNGPKAEVERVVTLIEQLDATSGTAGAVTEVYHLKHASAEEVVRVLESSLGAIAGSSRSSYYYYRYRGGAAAADEIKATAASTLNAIVVQAVPEQQERVAALLELLDVEQAGEAAMVQAVLLKQGDPDSIASAVNQILSPRDYRGEGPNVRVTAVSGAKTILVKGPSAEVERVVTLIEQLDSTSGTAGQLTKVYQLKHADAEEVVQVLESSLGAAGGSSRSSYYYYRYRGGSGASDQLKVTAATGLNAVVVQGNPAQQEQAESLITLLDVPRSSETTTVRTVTLKQANADEVASAVSRMLAPRDWRGEPSAVRVTAVSGSKTLLVNGPKAEVERVVTLIEQLDATSGTAGAVTEVYHLKHASAEEVVRVLESSLGAIAGSSRSSYYYYRYRGGAAAADEIKATAASTLNAIVVQAVPEQQKRVAALLELLDVEQAGEAAMVQAVLLKQGDPDSIASAVTQILSPRDYRGEAPNVRVTAVSGAKTVLVKGPEAEVERVVTLIEQLDATSGATGTETQVYHLQHADAAEVVRVLEETLGGMSGSGRSYYYSYRYRGGGSSEEVRVTSATALNAVVVQASPPRQQQAAQLIRMLDVEQAAEAGAVRTVRLEKADAEAVATAVNQALASPERRGEPAKVRVTPVAVARSLLVSGPTDETDKVIELIRGLDETSGDARLEMRIYKLQHAQASQVVEVLQGALSTGSSSSSLRRNIFFYGSRGRETTDQEFRVAAATALNAVVLQAPPEKQKLAAELIETLDVPQSAEAGMVQAIELEKANADAVAMAVNEVLAPRDWLANPPAVRVTTVSGTKTVLVNGPPAEVEKVAELVKRLDESGGDGGLDTQVYRLRYADADQVVQVLQATLGDTASSGRGYSYSYRYRGGGSANDFKVTAAAGLNAVVVQASAFKQTAAADLITKLDVQQLAGAAQVRTVLLEKAEPEAVAEAVNASLAPKERNGEPSAVRVTAVMGSRSVLVNGPEDEVERVIELIHELDRTGRGTGLETRVYRLENGDAADLARTLSQLLQGLARAQPRWSGRYNSSTFTVAPDERTNSLVVSGNPEAFAVVEQILPMLDKMPERVNRQVQFYWLDNADSFDVAYKLEAMFTDRDEKDQPTIEPDLFSNSLTVVATASDLAQIEEVIHRLDVLAEDSTLQVRLITLGTVPAQEIAGILTNIYPQMSPTTIRVMDRLPTPAVPPKTSTNAAPAPPEARLAPTGTATNAAPGGATAAVIGAAVSPAAGSVQADAVGTETASGPGQAPSTSPLTTTTSAPAVTATNTPAQVFLAVDKAANALVLSGPPSELDQIQWIISNLTSSFDEADTEIRQFPLQEADPVSVAKVLSALFQTPQPQPQRGASPPPQTENGRPAPPRDEDADRERERGREEPSGRQRGDQRDANQQRTAPPPRVAVVAEPRTRSVIVRASPADMPLMESVIKQLDAPGMSSQLEHRIIRLEHARPDQILPLLQEVIRQVDEVQPADPVAVGVDARQRALFLVGRTAVLDRLVTMIEELDVPSDYAEIELRVYPLKNAVAAPLASLLREMLAPSEGDARALTDEARALLEQVQRLRFTDDQGNPVTLDLTKPFKVIADPPQATAAGGAAQRLIIGSTPPNLVAMGGVVQLLDTVPIIEGLTARIVRLENVDAQVVLETLNAIFQQRTGGGGGSRADRSERRRPPSSDETRGGLAVAPNIALDPRNNAVILSGLPESIALAEAIITDLDRDVDVAMTEIRLFKLEHALASRLMPMLRSVFTEGGGRGGARGLNEQVSRLRLVLGGDIARLSDTATARAAVTIQADDDSSTLIVAARSDLMPLIEDVIRTLDVPAAGSFDQMRVFVLQHAEAAGMQRVLTDLTRRQGGQQLRPEDQPGISIDERTNALIVSGSEKAIAFIEGLLAELDQELPAELRNVKLVPLKNADAATVAASLQRLMDERARQRRGATTRGGGYDPQRVVIIADERTNTLLVAGAPDGFELVRGLAEELDHAGPSLTGQVRLIPLDYATAQTLANTLTALFNQRYQAMRSPEMQRNRPVILPDARSNSLLVAAGVEDNQAIDQLLGKLDREPENPALEITVLGLQVNDAARVAATLRSVFAARLQSLTPTGQTPAPAERVDVQADSLSNALIVTASPENLAILRGLLVKLDIEPVAADGVVQTFTLQHADVQRVATMLRSLIDQGVYRPGVSSGAGGRGAPANREALAVAADAPSNSLIVSASPENLVIVKELIRQLDTPEFTEQSDIRTYPLKHARASYLATVLEQFFRAKRQGESLAQPGQRSVPVTVTADDRSNLLLITGGKESFAAVERMVEQLDTPDAVARTNFRVFALRQATASKLATTLQRLFAGRPTRAGQTPEPVTVIADPWANALIVGAADDDMAMVESLVQQLDSETEEAGLRVQVFALEKADARRVSTTLESLLRGTGGGGAAPAVTVNVDERLNAVIVSAGENDLKRVAELVAQLDTDQVARVAEIRVFPLQNARAAALATILDDVLNTNPQPLGEANPNRQSLLQFIGRRDRGEEFIASALKEGVLIVPDTRINALVVSAPVDYMPLIEEVISYLDTSAPQIAKIRVFNLTNADARQMSLVLSSLFRLEDVGPADANDRSVQYTLVKPFGDTTLESARAIIGSAEEHALTVTVDLRTNSLLVGGTEHYVALASEIIETLDSAPAQERKAEVYRLRNTRAQDVEVPLRTFLQQDLDRITTVLGPNAVGTAQNLLEREVSIVAETNSNSLLISASPRYFDEVKTLLTELDQPQPQVLIQVLLAEITLDSTMELGVEWNYVGNGDPTFGTGTDFDLANTFNNFGGYYASLTGSDVQVLLRALRVDGRLEILSRPQILTADNQEATINIGQRVPIITSANTTPQGGQNNQFQYEDVGVILNVTPRISPDGFVKMDVGPTISALSSANVEVNPGVSVPIINQRTATTTVTVQSGQSVLIGGLISTLDDQRAKKVPFLGDIPGLGLLFRSKTSIQDRKELLIVLTPQILTKGDGVGSQLDPKIYTDEELRKSTLRDQIKRDPLQMRLLEELYPEGLEGSRTNAPNAPASP
ncbi:MAG: hypothetical protein H7A47_06270 [Verrucomicrobiales bacterium]|nr:hypothetical protein [Verrucomicrobiales bacterium]